MAIGNIYYFTPYALDKNLGAAYNRYMNFLPNDNDYACFVDADVMFLTPNFGQQIHDVITKHPDAGIYTTLTNRVGQLGQCYKGQLSNNPDILHHKRIAKVLQDSYYDKVIQIKQKISGHIMIIQKKTWRKYPFPKGLLGVDNTISLKLIKAGIPIYIMRGVYVLHYYRLVEGRTYKQHLK